MVPKDEVGVVLLDEEAGLIPVDEEAGLVSLAVVVLSMTEDGVLAMVEEVVATEAGVVEAVVDISWHLVQIVVEEVMMTVEMEEEISVMVVPLLAWVLVTGQVVMEVMILDIVSHCITGLSGSLTLQWWCQPRQR